MKSDDWLPIFRKIAQIEAKNGVKRESKKNVWQISHWENTFLIRKLIKMRYCGGSDNKNIILHLKEQKKSYLWELDTGK